MHMELWQSIPFACILLPLGSAALTSVLKPDFARRWTFLVLTMVTAVSAETGIPILCHVAEEHFAPALSDLAEPVFPITIRMKKPWE